MDFLLFGNDPFLDFINTQPVVEGQPVEQLSDGTALLNLLGRLDLPDTPSLRESPSPATHRAAALARELREDARKLLFEIRSGTTPDVSALNAWLQRIGRHTLVSQRGPIELTFQSDPQIPEAIWLAPLLQSGIMLLTSPQADRIKKCGNPACVLWYLDTSKNGTRRWCSMAMCGNVAKARQFRQRKRQEK